MATYHSVPLAVVLLLLIASDPTEASRRGGAHFGPMTRRVEAAIGGRAELSCSIVNLASDQTVSWHKFGLASPLAEGRRIFRLADRTRMAADLSPIGDTTEYNLTIFYTNAQDYGTYFCQALDNAGMIRSPKIKLASGARPDQEERITLTGNPLVERGGLISLTCLISDTGTSEGSAIQWFKNGNRVQTGNNVFIHMWNADTTHRAGSSLFIRRAQMTDAGSYVCTVITGNQQVYSALDVHVLNTDVNASNGWRIPNNV